MFDSDEQEEDIKSARRRQKQQKAVRDRQMKRLGIKPQDRFKRPLNCSECIFSVSTSNDMMVACAAKMDFEFNGNHFQPSTTYECERFDGSKEIDISGKQVLKKNCSPSDLEEYYLRKYNKLPEQEGKSALDKQIESLGDINWQEAIMTANSSDEMVTSKSEDFDYEKFKMLLHPESCDGCDHDPKKDCPECLAPIEDGAMNRIVEVYKEGIPPEGRIIVADLMEEEEEELAPEGPESVLDDKNLEELSKKFAIAEKFKLSTFIQDLKNQYGQDVLYGLARVPLVGKQMINEMAGDAEEGSILAKVLQKSAEGEMYRQNGKGAVLKASLAAEQGAEGKKPPEEVRQLKTTKKKRCSALQKNGAPCRRWCAIGKDVCPIHSDKDLPVKMAEISTQVRRAEKRKREEAVMSMLMTRIKNPKDLLKSMIDVHEMLKDGLMDPVLGVAITNASRLIAQLFEKTENMEDDSYANLTDDEKVDLYMFAKKHPKFANNLPVPKTVKAKLLGFDFSKMKEPDKIPSRQEVGWYEEEESKEND